MRKNRSSLGGLTIDRRETTNVHKYDDLTREEITARLAKLQEIPRRIYRRRLFRGDRCRNRTEPMATLEEKPAAEDTRDELRTALGQVSLMCIWRMTGTRFGSS